MSPLMTAVEHLLAEFGVTEPGAGAANHEAPAGELLDAVYMAWNQLLRDEHGEQDAIFEPEGKKSMKRSAEFVRAQREAVRALLADIDAIEARAAARRIENKENSECYACDALDEQCGVCRGTGMVRRVDRDARLKREGAAEVWEALSLADWLAVDQRDRAREEARKLRKGE